MAARHARKNVAKKVPRFSLFVMEASVSAKPRFLSRFASSTYAQESSWREDNRRISNGDQVNRVAALAMKRGKSVVKSSPLKSQAIFANYIEMVTCDDKGLLLVCKPLRPA